MGLTPQQLEAYRQDGYVVVHDVLDPDDLGRMRAAMKELLAGASAVSGHTALFDLEDSHTAEQPRVRRLKLPHQHHPAFHELIRSPKLLSLMTPILGPSVRMHTSKLNLKSADFGAPVEWHQDWAFYPHTNDDVLALGVLLDDFTPDNGPMMVVPGTHRGPIHDHHHQGVFVGAIDPRRITDDIDRAVPLIAKAGSVTLHHARLIHGSALNTSRRPRSFLLYEAMAADAWPLAGGLFGGLDEFNARMLCGEPTLEPRMTTVPVRMPFPKAPESASLYQSQKYMAQRFFDVAR
ncbi:MAG: phytanoyl-CoA dioxygenase family protein [Betaproteobacteria bacterium]|jgi:ectoine hydroxylase-related dioxygenase (phytanoyl-CoA dioxygenase family)|nr:phytanoyl-CoA dioxygenase family protein [Betaproteobacteria bacterium]